MSALPQSLRPCRVFHADFCLCHELSTSSQVKKEYMIFGGKPEVKRVLLMQSIPSEIQSRAQKAREWTEGCEKWSTEVTDRCHTGVSFVWLALVQNSVCWAENGWGYLQYKQNCWCLEPQGWQWNGQKQTDLRYHLKTQWTRPGDYKAEREWRERAGLRMTSQLLK